MATRSIITHQPEVACDMCGRRLLRGERPDVFIAAGDRRTVCELCVPRAAGEGWMRASETHAETSIHPPRSRRGRSLLERLRQRRGLPVSEAAEIGRLKRDLDAGFAGSPLLGIEEQGLLEPLAPEEAAGLGAAAGEPPAAETATAETPAAGVAEQAIEIFNASELAGRVAGIARALGEPAVTVRAIDETGDRAHVVVAWELCWYRYEIDLSERPATIAQIADGTELEQLDHGDQVANATADERGELTLLR